MSFQPIVPLTGYTGWRFLQRTMDTQQEAYKESVPVKRLTENFRENISQIRTAEDLVKDRDLLQVALGAFGLDDDINSKFFVEKVLDDGVLNDDALANKLSDPRYAALSKAFGFGDFDIPRTALSDFPDEIIDRYEVRQFELAVGEQNNDMRLAMNLQDGLADVLEASTSNTAHWFGIMGSSPLRSVFETALGFPASFGSLDIDKQLEQFKERASATFGSDQAADFTDPEFQEKLVRLFLVRSESQAFASSNSGSVALSLLQSSTFSYDN